MNAITLIGLISLGVLGVVCATLALWCKYEDGVLGHLALITLAFVSLIVVGNALDGEVYDFLPTTSGIFVAVTLFMLRHAWRAIKFRPRDEP